MGTLKKPRKENVSDPYMLNHRGALWWLIMTPLQFRGLNLAALFTGVCVYKTHDLIDTTPCTSQGSFLYRFLENKLKSGLSELRKRQNLCQIMRLYQLLRQNCDLRSKKLRKFRFKSESNGLNFPCVIRDWSELTRGLNRYLRIESQKKP